MNRQSMRNIPLAKPYTDQREVKVVADVIESGWVSQGTKVIEFESAVAEYVGARFGIATNSCTSALHLSLRVLGVTSGDVVICPAFTCMATANAIRHTGARPQFVEIDPRTFNIDPDAVAEAISDRTTAIMVVHQIGLAADMFPIQEIARKHDLRIVEDAATALGATYHGKQVGSLGSPTCYSFHPRKVITTGEGGMIVSDDEEFAERARIVRSHGASVSDLDRHKAMGTVYASYPVVGYNYRLTDIQASIGVEQMRKLPWILEQKARVASTYEALLNEVDEIESPHVPDYATHSYQSYLIRFTSSANVDRDALLQAMAKQGISCRHGIAPLHQEPYYQKLYGHTHLPISEEVSRSTMFLPIYPTMTEDDVKYIVDNLKALLVDTA
jgi:dTDP-4-amino-4,6-dideoxygalactose transaminase